MFDQRVASGKRANRGARMRVGVISDTHGLLQPEAIVALRGSDLIVHAGDIGRLDVLEQLRDLAPTHAVRGNIDIQPWARKLPDTAVVRAGRQSWQRRPTPVWLTRYDGEASGCWQDHATHNNNLA
jgi:Calcineurin-like phosphoesterase superfamily domain